MESATDTQLVAQVLSGNEAAFAELHERYRVRLQGFVRRRMSLSPEAAEDVVQDVFATLVQRDYAALRQFAGRSSLYTYLCAIASRRAFRLLRRQPAVADPPVEDLPVAAEDSGPAQIAATDVRRAMGQLPEEFCAPLMLHHFGGLEYHEIADMLGIPTNTVATRICRAKKRLRELLSA